MHPCCGLQSSLITRVSPWLSGKDSQSFGCFAFTSIVTPEHIWVLWGAAGIHRILRETSKLLAEFFTWDIYLGVIDLITRKLHALVRPSCTWITPEFTRSNHIHLNTDPFRPPLLSSPVELGNSQTMNLNHRTRKSKVMATQAHFTAKSMFQNFIFLPSPTHV